MESEELLMGKISSGFAAVSRKDLIRHARALKLGHRTTRPPYEVGLNITASEGFSNISAYSQLLTFLLIARISAALR